MKKALGSDNHEILLKILNYAELRNTVNNSIRLYLTDRSHIIVKINDHFIQPLDLQLPLLGTIH